jgi:hypothetical protein
MMCSKPCRDRWREPAWEGAFVAGPTGHVESAEGASAEEIPDIRIGADILVLT